MPRSTFCGTLEYMAPEMLKNEPHDHSLDIWSLGILLYELYHGNAPFTGKNPIEISQKITKRQIRFSSSCKPDYKDLID
jgi:serine/threonine protein kinase